MALKARFVSIPPHQYRQVKFVTSMVLNNLVTVRNVGDNLLVVRKLYSNNGRTYFFWNSIKYYIGPGHFIVFRLPPRTFSGLLFGSALGTKARVSWRTVPIG